MTKQLRISTMSGVLAIFAFSCLTVLTGYSQTCGLFTNAGFEDNLNGWTVSSGGQATIVTATQDKHSGARAVRIGTAEGGINSTGTFPVVAGQQITFEVWAKISGSPVWAGVGMDFLNASNAEVGEVNLTVTATSYTLYADTRTVPAGATKVRIWTYKVGTTGNLFLDDFCLNYRCGSLLNNGFENGLNGWVNDGNTAISTDEHSGVNAAITGPGNGGLHYGTSIPATGGQSVVLKVWGKVSGSPGFAGVGIDYFDASNTELDEEVINVVNTSYTEYTVQATVPSGTTRISLWTYKSGTGNLFLDDLCLTVGSGGGGTFTVTVDKSVTHQTMDGFGFFGAQDSWWDAPSSLWSSAWGDQVISDLGVTIWRTEYYPPSDNLHTQDADWNKQLPVIRGLRDKANAAGVDLKFIYTVWTPPSSMKIAVSSDGQTRFPGTPNPTGTRGGALDPGKYTQFANYLIDGIEFFENEGIDLYAISPQNEPGYRQDFNSCKYLPSWYVQMLNGVIPTVKASYPDVKIFGSEFMLIEEAADEKWQSNFHKAILDNATARNNIDIMAVHGYRDGVAPTSGSYLAELWSDHRTRINIPMNKPQWMTETSGYIDTWIAEGDDAGSFNLALDIMSALNNGNVSGWVWWQGSENPGTQPISRYALMNGTVKNKKYYISKHFYRYIRPGAVRVGATSSNSNVFASAFHHASNGTHTIVIVNTATSAQNITVGGTNLPSGFTVFRTTSGSDNCSDKGNYTTGTTLNLPAQSIVTLQAGGTPLGGASARTKSVASEEANQLMREEESVYVAYPNPVGEEGLTIDVSGLQRTGEHVEVSLSDLSGKLVSRHVVKASSKLQLRRDELPAKGIYLLKINTGAVIKRVKIILE